MGSRGRSVSCVVPVRGGSGATARNESSALPTSCHACALHTLEATGEVRKVSLWLGHSSVQTTEMYLQADPTDKLDTLDKWRPPSLRKGRFNGVQDELLAMLAGT